MIMAIQIDFNTTLFEKEIFCFLQRKYIAKCSSWFNVRISATKTFGHWTILVVYSGKTQEKNVQNGSILVEEKQHIYKI